jgi:hypothetical protein
MWRFVVLVGVIVVAAGLAIAGGLGSQEPEPTPAVARRADIVCAADGTFVRTERVLPLRDGVHVRVENVSSAELLEIRSPTDEVLAEIPVAFEGPSEATLPLPPGTATVTCTSEVDPDDAPSAVLTVVDAEDRWTSPELSCGDATQRSTFIVPLSETERARSTARRAVPGLRPGDTLVSPGYPSSLWHGDLLIVVRDGIAIARITRAQDAGTWNVFVDACPGTDLGSG